MNILIVGLGSIGKRHLENLVHLGVNNISIVRRNAIAYKDFRIFDTIANACENEDFTHAIIATPTSLHLQNFKALILFNISNIYLEKPIAASVADGVYIETLSKKYPSTKIFVGYDLRFDPGLQKVKEVLTSNSLGKPLSFQVEVGQYLPDWRPHEDYRNGMSASKALGGGVMLDLIHEFDYITWLLGPISKVVGMHDQISSLEIDTEDVSKVILQTDTGAIGTISLDYLQKVLARSCKIVCDVGIIQWDYVTSKVSWSSHTDTIKNVFEYSQFERNDRFITIMKAFISNNENDKKHIATLAQGLVSLKVVEAAKTSNKTQKIQIL